MLLYLAAIMNRYQDTSEIGDNLRSVSNMKDVKLKFILVVKSLQERKCGFSFYLPLMAVVYLGFLTHYYFAVYLFFLAAAMELYLLLERAEQKSWGQKWKDCLIYATAVIGAMVLAVVSYPACLSHIFRGYRGTEAMGAFFGCQF